jgi:WD40 repeat protein
MLVAQSPDTNILLSVMDWDTEKIGIFYSDSGDPNNMNFFFVTNVSVPKPANVDRPPLMGPIVVFLEFSADGSKFATATSDGMLSVWDVRSQIPLMVLTVEWC